MEETQGGRDIAPPVRDVSGRRMVLPARAVTFSGKPSWTITMIW